MTKDLTIITGPTGSGKTRLAATLKNINPEIVIVEEAGKNWRSVEDALEWGSPVVAILSGSYDIHHVQMED